MASLSAVSSVDLFLLFVLVSSIAASPAFSMEFEVGGGDGWEVPPSSKDPQMYNQWASKNRFNIGDIISESSPSLPLPL